MSNVAARPSAATTSQLLRHLLGQLVRCLVLLVVAVSIGNCAQQLGVDGLGLLKLLLELLGLCGGVEVGWGSGHVLEEPWGGLVRLSW
jgi:hypothetical protein